MPQHTKPGFLTPWAARTGLSEGINYLDTTGSALVASQNYTILKKCGIEVYHTVNSSEEAGENLKNLRWSVVKMSMTAAKKKPTPEIVNWRVRNRTVDLHTDDNAITNALGFMKEFVYDRSIWSTDVPRSGLNSEYDNSLDITKRWWRELLKQLLEEAVVDSDISPLLGHNIAKNKSQDNIRHLASQR